MNRLKQRIALVSCLAVAPVGLFAQQVTISNADKSISIKGTISSFDDDTYFLTTSLGDLKIPRSSTTCEGEACPKAKVGLTLAVSLSEAGTSELMQVLVTKFASKQSLMSLSFPNVDDAVERIELREDTNTTLEGEVSFVYQPVSAGFQQLLGGGIDLNVSTTPVPVAVADRAVASGQIDLRDERWERVIALDALVPIVHPNNPVRSISLEDLARISGGRITNWSELGGNDAPIRMLLPTEDTALDAAFKTLVLDPNRVRLRRSVERAESQSQANSAVLADVNAITITNLSKNDTAKILPISQSCGPLAYADAFAIKAEEYPLNQRIYGYSGNTNQTPIQQSFIDYVSSLDAQASISDAGYVDQTIITQPISLQGTRMASAILSAGTNATLGLVKNLVVDLAAADRLSTTFRFTSGSSQLDTKSQNDVQRTVEFLNSDEGRNRKIQVIGFTDNVGRFDLNERLARQRAASVRDALVASLGGDVLAGRIEVSTYGPLAPVGCNDTAAGRESNRRVEIWLQ